jgi:hypothetical protein
VFPASSVTEPENEPPLPVLKIKKDTTIRLPAVVAAAKLTALDVLAFVAEAFCTRAGPEDVPVIVPLAVATPSEVPAKAPVAIMVAEAVAAPFEVPASAPAPEAVAVAVATPELVPANAPAPVSVAEAVEVPAAVPDIAPEAEADLKSRSSDIFYPAPPQLSNAVAGVNVGVTIFEDAVPLTWNEWLLPLIAAVSWQKTLQNRNSWFIVMADGVFVAVTVDVLFVHHEVPPMIEKSNRNVPLKSWVVQAYTLMFGTPVEFVVSFWDMLAVHVAAANVPWYRWSENQPNWLAVSGGAPTGKPAVTIPEVPCETPGFNSCHEAELLFPVWMVLVSSAPVPTVSDSSQLPVTGTPNADARNQSVMDRNPLYL